MNPINIIKNAQAKALTNEDGETVEIGLLPGLDEDAVALFESSLPCALSEEIRELLHFCRGFEGVGVDQVDFTGQNMMFGDEVIFPHAVPIASDGYGNFWVVDLSPDATEFGPIWFACHDAPVILYQSPQLSDFLSELFKMCEAPYKSLVDEVHNDRIHDVWRTNPNVLAYQDCQDSSDSILREFSDSLDPSFGIIDLRTATVGDGFSWGRYGPKTVVKRHGNLPVFAYQRKKKFLGRLFGK
jgi:cell wall assembly regulator SMI1